MTKVRTFLRTDRKDKDGRSPVYLLVSDRGKRYRYDTGFSGIPFSSDKNGRTSGDFVEETGRFHEGKGVKGFFVSRKENGKIVRYSNQKANNQLSALEVMIDDILTRFKKEGKDWTVGMVKEAFEKIIGEQSRKPVTNFYQYAQGFINGKKEKSHYKSALITDSALRSLKNFDKNLNKRELKDITKDYLDKYIAYCQEEIVEENGTRYPRNQKNTIRLYLSEIRAILNQAIKDNLLDITSYPFKGNSSTDHIKVSDYAEGTRKRFISRDGLAKIAHTELEGKPEIARHLFLFSFHARGINWLDMAKLTSKNIKTEQRLDGKQVKVIKYHRSKTDKAFNIEINEHLQAELDWFRNNCPLYGKYLLPIVTQSIAPERFDEYVKERRKKYNKALQKMAKQLELPEAQLDISSYWARHSFAMMLRTNGVSIDKIGQTLGHKDFKTTLTYLKSFSDEEMAKITNIEL